MRYGFNWQGSKNKIAKDIVDILPKSDCLVDLFSGGCAITHYALTVKKWKHIIANDIKGSAVFFKDVLEGKVKNIYEPITREEFNLRKSYDIKVAACWSFGGDCDSYLWSKEKEGVKLAAFKMLTADSVEARYAFYKVFIRELDNYNTDFDVLEGLQAIEGLNALKTIQNSGGKDVSIDSYTLDYQDVDIPKGATVYCDIPYSNTSDKGNDYKNKFDSERFYAWALSKDFPVFVSEYSMPDEFTQIWSKNKTCAMCSACNSKQTTEKLFVQSKYAKDFQSSQMELYE